MGPELVKAYGKNSMIQLTVLSLMETLKPLVGADSHMKQEISSSICLPDGRYITVTLELRIGYPDTVKPWE